MAEPIPRHAHQTRIGRRARPATLVTVVAALLMLAAGAAKLAGALDLSPLGVPSWAVPLIGAVEVAGAVLLLVPRTRFWAAAGLLAVLAGALGTHLLNADWGGVPGPILPGVLVALVAWLHRPPTLLPRPSGARPEA